MNYVKANTILPESLIKEIQKYIQGDYIYIPICPEHRKKWGEKSKHREYIKSRNSSICIKHATGMSVANLAEEYFLSESSIKKIVYNKNK